jgi:hypothetical protein
MRWLPSRSANPREAHIPFYNRVFTRDNPIWNNGPGTLWNCKCDVEPTDDPAESGAIPVAVTPAPGIDNNPGESGEVFTTSHPYYKRLSKDEAKAAKELEENNSFTTAEGDGGFLVHISKGHNKNELKANLAFAKRLAGVDKADITLLGIVNEPGAINYDCIRQALNEAWELKVPTGKNLQSAIQHELKGTKKQRFVFELTAEHSLRQIFKGIETTFITHKNRAKTIQKLDFLLLTGRLLRFTRKDFESRDALINAFKSQMAAK